MDAWSYPEDDGMVEVCYRYRAFVSDYGKMPLRKGSFVPRRRRPLSQKRLDKVLLLVPMGHPALKSL